MKLTDMHYLVSFDADLKLGMPRMRAATPQEAERNDLQRRENRLSNHLSSLGLLALGDLDDPVFIASRREAISLHEALALDWIDFYDRYPPLPPQPLGTVVYHDPFGGETA